MGLVTDCLFGTNVSCSCGRGSMGRDLIGRFVVVDTKVVLGIARVEITRYVQSITSGARHYIYADDTAIAVQDNNFE